jgi:hypothetical protein
MQPPIQKPSPSELALFTKRIEAAPDIHPLRLKVGQSLKPDGFLAIFQLLLTTSTG